MPVFDVRDPLQFPQGENSTDVFINGIHFNRTALYIFNYTLYDNGTLSNTSHCYLIFNQYQPSMLMNGTFINGTSCYNPYYEIKARGSLGLVFACLFAASIMFTLINLRKHGRLFLPSEKRFRAVGRRWQWYWLLFVAACGIISGITSIDVDRDYLQSMAIILQSFFYYLMEPGILAAVWEGLPQDNKRERKEFYLPLAFYLFAWLDFFMTIPRSWTAIEQQHSRQQQDTKAALSGTDGRFKAGSVMAFIAWCIICYALQHSIHHYKPRNRGLWNSLNGFCRYCPMKLFLIIWIAFIRVAYGIASAFDFSISPLKYNASAGWVYGLGYGPVFLIVLILEIYGYIDQNEDLELITQRRERGRAVDAELGINKKPSWWSKLHGDAHLDTEQRLKNLTTEIGGGRATQRNIERGIELGNMTPRVDDPFTDESSVKPLKNRPTSTITNSDDSSTLARSGRKTSTTGGQQPRVRSMLDI
ncbi:MAG: hypothetical protein M1827_001737 [Pycnora praestabilis]|nr:MAG: hypothetical protein M1827_001737 [Pycnora praestabilis]